MTPTDHLEKPPAANGRRLLDALLHGGRLFGRGSGRALALLFKALVVAYFIFCALFLTLRYALLPNIDRYKGTVEQVATQVVGRQVTIGTIVADWHGLNPRLALSQVVIYNRTGDAALRLPRVSATVSWLSVPTASLRLSALEILRPDLEIERDADGDLFVGGIFLDPDREGGGGGGLDWLLQQRQIVIRDGWVRWKDAKRDAPELVLSGMTVLMENHWLQHRLAIRATPPAEIGAPLDLRARFSHSPFARQISDASGWTGILYLDWQQADLARGKTWIDYPVEIEEGQGAIRAWLSFDHAAVTDLTADLALNNLSARLAPNLDMLQLTRVSGRIGAGETVTAGARRLFNFGRRGHTIALQDFSFETADGLQLPPTTIRERYTEARANQAAETEVQVASADLGPLTAFARRLPLADEQHQLLEELAPQGRLSNFSAVWQGDWPNIKSYQVKGDFSGLSLRARAAAGPLAARPGFANMSGNLKLNEKGGDVRLNADKASLELPGLFADPVFTFDELSLSAHWTMLAENRIQVQVTNADFLHDGMRGRLSGKYQSGSGPRDHGELDLQAQVDEAEIRRTARYLPSFTEPHLAHWLGAALLDGKLRDARVNLKGRLNDFPFRAGRGGDKSTGQFLVTGRLVDAKLDYSGGELDRRGKPLWPVIENINGRLLVDRTLLDIQADTAQSHKVNLSKVRATIPDLMAADSLLNVDGTAQGPLQELLAFTLDSPVGEWIGHFTDEARGSGNAKLALKLEMPLHRLPETKVKGSLQFAGNDVALYRSMPPIVRANGELRFNEKGFELANLRGGFLGGPVNLSGGTQRDGNIAVRADGSLTADGVRRNFPAPATNRLLQRISGGTRYGVQVNVRNHHPEIIVESNLQGVGLDFPSPLKKTAGESLPLRFELQSQADEGGFARDEIRASLVNLLNVRYARRKAAGGEWEVVRGGIGVNLAAPQPDSGLVVNVNVRSLDLDAWSATMSGLSGGASAASAAPSGESDPAQNAAQNAPQNAPPNAALAQYIDTDVLAVRAGELIVGNKKLDNVVVGASHADGNWQANIASTQVSGYVSWRESRSGRGRGRVTARLASLIVPPSAASDVSDLLEGRGAATQIPALDIVAENFELFGKKLGRLELNANNASTPNGREWRINRLSVVNPDANMSATGRFASSDGHPQTSLNYQLDIVNAGKLLDRLGFANVLRGGRGRMSGDVNWKGVPFSLDIPSLNGQLEMDLSAGQFLKVDPGAAKLLGVLSLQSLPRRLTLDFRDVFSEGFAFDGATARANIAQGIMSTDSFKMRSVNALVLMDGTVDLAQESQNMHVVVIPEINAGAASVAYGLINPVLGLGSFLAQLFLRDPLMRAFTMEYQISGSWRDPNIRKLPRSAFAEAPKPGNEPNK
jgi:uncharacterized protein (TIGR02099 family)